MKYRVDVIQAGRTRVPTMEIYWMDVANLDKWEPIVFTFALVRGGGRTILINSGPPADSKALSDYWVRHVHPNHELHVSEEERPQQALARYGVKPEEVDAVLVTPLTAYTTGNLDLFPNAKIMVGRKGWIDFFAPEPYVHRLPKHMYMADPIFEYVMHKAWDRIVLLDDGECEVFPGIRSRFAGGHHRSSMAFAIDTERGKAVYSDCFFKYGNVEKRIPLGINESIEETLKSYDIIRKEADIVLPPYDPELFVRHPGGTIA